MVYSVEAIEMTCTK